MEDLINSKVPGSKTAQEAHLRLSKDPGLISTIARLRERWGKQAFEVVDHWEANRHGIGVARAGNPSALVYIDNFEKPSWTYDVELERPAAADVNQPYAFAGTFQDISFDTLTDLVGKHLQLESVPV